MNSRTIRLARTPQHGSRRGSATVVTLLVVFSLMTVCMAFIQLGTSDQDRLLSSFDDDRALQLAESGLGEAVTAIRAGATGNVGTQDVPAWLGGGVFWSEATDTGSGMTRVKVTAMIGKGRRAVEAIVDTTPGEPPLFETVLNSDESMTLNSDVVIDSYDSSIGDYLMQQTNWVNGHAVANEDGDVRSNANIYLNAGTTVAGDAIPGPAGIVDDAATGALITGATTPADSPFTFAPIEYPPTTGSLGNYSASGTGDTLSPGTYEFDTFSVGSSAVLTVEGPAEIVVDDFSGGKNGRLLVDATNGPVTFYVRGTYTHIKDFEVDAVQDSAAAIAFMVDGANDIQFPAHTNIRGAYYAPNSAITFNAGNECWGAFAGSRISMSNAMRFHYDEALLDHWTRPDDDGENPRNVLAWSEADVAQALLADRRDPLLVLGVDRVDLPTPPEAWDPDDGGQ